MSLILKVFSALVFWGIFVFVIFQLPYPNSLTQASIFQLSGFFIPLFLALTFTINIFLKFLIRSMLISTALMTFLILQAIQTLNLLTFILTCLAFGLLFSYFKKKSNLTSLGSIPKLVPSGKVKHLQRRRR